MCAGKEDKDQVLAETRDSLAWMFGDIWKARMAKANVGAMILTILALECFGIRRKGETEKGKYRSEGCFNDFVNRYLCKKEINTGYNKLKNEPFAYGDLRSLLVHFYSKKGYEFTEDCPEEHLTMKQGRLQIDVDWFIYDSWRAIENYLTVLESDPAAYDLFKKAYNDIPLLREGEKGKT